MKSYKQIRADIARLEREAEAARKAESAGVVAKIRKLAAQYGLKAADIGLDSGGQESSGGSNKPSAKATPKKTTRKATAKKASRSGAGVAKYRDPKSGKTWTGFGRVPQWLASAKKRGAFLIGSSDAQADAGTSTEEPPTTAVARSRSAPRAGKKAGAKTAARKAVPAGKAAKRPAARKRAAGTTDTGEATVSTQ